MGKGSGSQPVDFNRLRLKHHGDPEMLVKILQAECRHKCTRKLSGTLGLCEGFRFPSLALAEMSTSDTVAALHASLAAGASTVLDMTAGLGIDTFHFAAAGMHVTALELDPTAADCLVHNAAALGLDGMVNTLNVDSVAWLAQDAARHYDLIFIDPARRDGSGRHVSLRQCMPDITAHIDLLLERSRCLLVKMSPMIDITQAAAELGHTPAAVYTIGTVTECKEVVMQFGTLTHTLACTTPALKCFTVNSTGQVTHYEPPADFNGIDTDYATPHEGGYLMQPYPAVMKGTGGRVAGYGKLHHSTHLYFSPTRPEGFPGRIYSVVHVMPFNKHTCRELKRSGRRFNVVCRGFPLTAPALVARLGIKEGGTDTLFGATLPDGSLALIDTVEV